MHPGGVHALEIFHAERHTQQSVFGSKPTLTASRRPRFSEH
jgi:hypothetical protein